MNTYDWYKNTYLETHLKLVEQSISLAQSEFQTRVQMLQFYEKQLDNLRQGKTASGTGASREAVGKFNASQLTKQQQRLSKQASLEGYTFGDLIQPMADQMATLSGTSGQGGVLTKIAQEQGYEQKGENQLERVRIAQELVASGAKAARKAGKTPNMRDLTSAAMTIARVDDVALMGKTEAELIELQKKIEPINLATGSVTRSGRRSASGQNVDLGFNVQDVTVGPDGKTLGIYYVEDGNAVFSPLTIEQERIYRLENRVNRLRSQMDETYGQDIDIEKIIERGRDIYSRQYSPQRRKMSEQEQRAALLSQIEATDKERGTNFGGLYTAFSSVKENDKRIDDIRRGDPDDEIASAAATIYQMKRNKQDGLANEVALGLLGGDQDKANQAVGLAIRALMEDSQGKKTPRKPFTDTLEDALKGFASRMSDKKEDKPKEQPKPQVEIPTEADVMFDESGGTINPEAEAAEAAKPKPKLTAPSVFAPIKDGGKESWEYNPATNRITYIQSTGKLGTTSYDATQVMQGTAGNSAAQAWAKSNASTITDLASQQALFDEQEKAK